MEMNIMEAHSQPRSAYEETTYSLQRSVHKKMGSLPLAGVGFIISGIVLAFTLVYMHTLNGGNVDFLFEGAGLLAVASFSLGLAMVFRSVFSRRRIAICPYCGAKHHLFRRVRSYVCDGCGCVLRFSGERNELVKVACPYCSLEWAASPDSGSTRCFSCGAGLVISSGSAQFSPESDACPACAALNAEGSFFCWQCGETIAPLELVESPRTSVIETVSVKPNREGMDFITIRAASPIGLLYNAIYHLNLIIPQANNLPEENQLNLNLLRDIRGSIEAAEEALEKNPEYPAPVKSILTAVTHLTARILKDVKIGGIYFSEEDEYTNFFRDLSGAFNRILAKVSATLNEPLPQDTKWPDPLLKVSRGPSVGGQPPKFAAVIENEADLKDWVKRQLLSDPILPLRAPARLSARRMAS